MKVKCSKDKWESCSDGKMYSQQATGGEILRNAIATLNILQKYF